MSMFMIMQLYFCLYIYVGRHCKKEYLTTAFVLWKSTNRVYRVFIFMTHDCIYINDTDLSWLAFQGVKVNLLCR
jgi:hypothetical protein